MHRQRPKPSFAPFHGSHTALDPTKDCILVRHSIASLFHVCTEFVPMRAVLSARILKSFELINNISFIQLCLIHVNYPLVRYAFVLCFFIWVYISFEKSRPFGLLAFPFRSIKVQKGDQCLELSCAFRSWSPTFGGLPFGALSTKKGFPMKRMGRSQLR